MKTRILIFILVGIFSSFSRADDSQNESLTKEQRKARIAWDNAEQSLELGLPEKAEIEFSLAISLTPENAELYYGRAEARYGMGKYREAVSDFDRYLQDNPSDAGATFERGITKSLLKPEDVVGACVDMKRAEELGQDISAVNGLDIYCKSQPGWD